MCTPLTQNRLVKQIHDYDHIPDFYSSVGATTPKS